MASRDDLESKKHGTAGFIRDEALWTIDTFSLLRFLVASHYPADSLAYASDNKVWQNFFEIVKHHSEEEKKAMFSGNAARVYRLRRFAY